MTIPETNLADYVWQNVDEYADNTAVVCGMTGRSYKYGVARGMAQKFGSALVRMGACKGDVMGMVGLTLLLLLPSCHACCLQVLPNIPEFPLAFLGAAGAGLAVTTFNPTYR